MKKITIILIFVSVLIVLIVIFRGFSGEDSWIKDNKGVYIKHGVPSSTPDYATEQQDAVLCALGLYGNNKQQGMEFSSQCLGNCYVYSADIVHVPRNDIDNLAENQCEDQKNNETPCFWDDPKLYFNFGHFKKGITKHFIELDKDGNVVRVS